MNDFKHFHPTWHHTLNVVVVSLAFIIVGVLWILRNLGMIDPALFTIIVSWQMLLILWGVIQLIKQHYIGGGDFTHYRWLFFIAAGNGYQSGMDPYILAWYFYSGGIIDFI